MSRGLQILNLAGVLALAGLSAWQWQQNRSANLEVIRLERTRIEHEQKIADQEKAIQGCNADWDAFRAQLGETADANLKEASAQIQALAENRNAAVTKFNELAEKYNATVQTLNDRTRDYNGLVQKYNALAKNASERDSK